MGIPIASQFTGHDYISVAVMDNPPAIRLLQVDVTPVEPMLWRWCISEAGLEVVCNYAASRQTARIDGVRLHGAQRALQPRGPLNSSSPSSRVPDRCRSRKPWPKRSPYSWTQRFLRRR